MADYDGGVPLPPDVWAKIAGFTRSRRGIARVSQLCRASHDGVTKSARPWRALEKKYGIRLVDQKSLARQNAMKYATERAVVKRGFENLALTGNLIAMESGGPRRPRGGTLGYWESSLRFVMRDPDFYHAGLTALLHKNPDEPSGVRQIMYDAIRAALVARTADGIDYRELFCELQTPAKFLGGTERPEGSMAMICAAYTAVRKSGVTLLILHERDSGLMMDLERLLTMFNEDVVDGLAMPNWVVHTADPGSFHNNITREIMHLRNSSSIFLCHMESIPPLGLQFDGVIACNIRVTDLSAEWTQALQDFAPSERRVHFTLPQSTPEPWLVG